MFDVERFVAECREVVESGAGREGMAALVERTVSEPGAVLAGLGEPERAGVHRLHVDDPCGMFLRQLVRQGPTNCNQEVATG